MKERSLNTKISINSKFKKIETSGKIEFIIVRNN